MWCLVNRSFDYIGLLEDASANEAAPVTAVGEGEDFLEVKEMLGFRKSWPREIAHWLLVICTGNHLFTIFASFASVSMTKWYCMVWIGFLALLAIRWFERRYLPYRYRRVGLHEAQYILIDGVHSGYEWVNVERLSVQSSANRDAATSAPRRSPPVATAAVAGGLNAPIGGNNLSAPLLHSQSSEFYTRSPDNDQLNARQSSSNAGGVDGIPLNERMIIFRHTRFVYDIASQSFRRLAYPSTMPAASASRLERIVSKGLSSRRHRAHLSRYGFNDLPVSVPPVLQLLKDEVLHPFFIFQIYSVVLWYASLRHGNSSHRPHYFDSALSGALNNISSLRVLF
jgi:hypothetical protein